MSKRRQPDPSPDVIDVARWEDFELEARAELQKRLKLGKKKLPNGYLTGIIDSEEWSGLWSGHNMVKDKSKVDLLSVRVREIKAEGKFHVFDALCVPNAGLMLSTFVQLKQK